MTSQVRPSLFSRGKSATGHSFLGIVLLLSLLLPTTSVGASPLEIQQDRSDNTMTFTYDAESGTVTQAQSSKVIARGDRLEFTTYVRARPASEVGRRLLGLVQLRQHGKKALRLDGTLSIVVEDAAGRAETLETEINIVLRPKKGGRFRAFRWRFDLPSGDYTAYGTFQK